MRTCWNWKAATLSAFLRGLVFVGITVSHGWRSMTLAFAAETLYRAGAAGFCAAFVQAIRKRKPQWLVTLVVLVVLPAGTLTCEYLLHHALGTPNLAVGMAISFAISCVTALFDLYAMRQGVLLVGEQGARLSADLRRLPGLLLCFVMEPLRWACRERQP
jgi:hypothetical protein